MSTPNVGVSCELSAVHVTWTFDPETDAPTLLKLPIVMGLTCRVALLLTVKLPVASPTYAVAPARYGVSPGRLYSMR